MRPGKPEKSGRPRGGEGRKALTGPVIYGLHAAEAAILNPKRVIRQVFLTENASLKLGPKLAERGVAATIMTPGEIDALLQDGAVHQGIVLAVEPLPQMSLEEFLDSLAPGTPLEVAILDQVTDPHNVGAVLRSAAAFGIRALIVQSRHSPPLSAALAKAASGGLDYVPVIEAVNLARTVDTLKDSGFHCIGFDSDAERIFGADEATFPRIAFLFGSEDRGLRRLLREGCDAIYALNAPGPIKSLNVSNAAAIVFHVAACARETVAD